MTNIRAGAVVRFYALHGLSVAVNKVSFTVFDQGVCCAWRRQTQKENQLAQKKSCTQSCQSYTSSTKTGF